jgi:hypothetical protein
MTMFAVFVLQADDDNEQNALLPHLMRDEKCEVQPMAGYSYNWSPPGGMTMPW